MDEVWEKWQFTDLNEEGFELYKFLWDWEELKIEIVNDNIILRLTFKTEDVVSFRQSDEWDRLKTMNYVLGTYGSDYFVKWPFCIVKNSNYFKWLDDEKFNHLCIEGMIKHFCIVTLNDVVDLLVCEEPKLEIINKKI